MWRHTCVVIVLLRSDCSRLHSCSYIIDLTDMQISACIATLGRGLGHRRSAMNQWAIYLAIDACNAISEKMQLSIIISHAAANYVTSYMCYKIFAFNMPWYRTILGPTSSTSTRTLANDLLNGSCACVVKLALNGVLNAWFGDCLFCVSVGLFVVIWHQSVGARENVTNHARILKSGLPGYLTAAPEMMTVVIWQSLGQLPWQEAISLRSSRRSRGSSIPMVSMPTPRWCPVCVNWFTTCFFGYCRQNSHP